MSPTTPAQLPFNAAGDPVVILDGPTEGAPLQSWLQVTVEIPRLAEVGIKVDSDDLVGAAEVASILRLSHPSSVTTYLRRYADFPKPVVDLSASRVRLWRRQDIERWHDTRTKP